MAVQTDNPTVGTDIRAVLSQLRRRIRTYVWLEGIALALLWLGTTFWVGMAIDYLPVLVGASEMPRPARAVLLGIIGIMLAYVLYRWIVRRAFARMPDRSMAVLLERRFRHFHDSLVTAVEMDDHPENAREFNSDMLARTRQEAQSGTADVQVREVLRLAPLVSKMTMAALVIVPIGVLYAVNAPAVETWFNRLYLLGDQPWPRAAHIEVAGVQIQRTAPSDGSVSLSELIPFDERREIKVAKGTGVVLKVQADAGKDAIPEYCTVYYETEEGDQASVNMQKLGRIRDNWQTYVCDSKPFRGILSNVRFDVRGLDHRVRDYRLTVVPTPAIVSTQLDCTFPDYMVDQQLSLWLPRTLDLASGTQLPHGTHILIRARANKDLQSVEIRNLQTEEVAVVDIPPQADPREFTYEVPQLKGDLSLDVLLHDTDGVISDPPIRLYVAGIEDTAPIVKTRLRGIGTAVTPDVVLPAVGEISDDYDVDKTWFEIAVNDGTPREYSFELGEQGVVAAEVDFRAERAKEDAIELKPQDKIAVTLLASDKCTLADTPNVGSGDRYQLDVVTPEELLAMLERKELGLRRRLEQIIDELSEMRDSVSRIKRAAAAERGTAPEDTLDASEVDETNDPALGKTAEERASSLRLLRTQRAVVQCDKSAQETLGVAASFDDIREELLNNRVDTKDRESRIKGQIADPLRQIGDVMFADLNMQLKQVQQVLDDAEASDTAVDLAVEQADAILLELDKVLQKMLELESFNELMNIVRSLIEDQQELIDKTKEEQKKGALELLR